MEHTASPERVTSSAGEIDRNGEIVGALTARIGVAVTAPQQVRPGRRRRVLAACSGDSEQADRILAAIGGAS